MGCQKVIEQMEEWITADYTKVSINVSPKDLENNDYSIIHII